MNPVFLFSSFNLLITGAFVVSSFQLVDDWSTGAFSIVSSFQIVNDWSTSESFVVSSLQRVNDCNFDEPFFETAFQLVDDWNTGESNFIVLRTGVFSHRSTSTSLSSFLVCFAIISFLYDSLKHFCCFYVIQTLPFELCRMTKLRTVIVIDITNNGKIYVSANSKSLVFML